MKYYYSSLFALAILMSTSKVANANAENEVIELAKISAAQIIKAHGLIRCSEDVNCVSYIQKQIVSRFTNEDGSFQSIRDQERDAISSALTHACQDFGNTITSSSNSICWSRMTIATHRFFNPNE